MKKKDEILVRSSGKFKLKPKEGKSFQLIHLKDFGFIPEDIVFERKSGSWFVVSAILTDEEIEKQNKLKKEKGKENK